ncbi:MAG TPA: phage major capsid protein [Burkholderiales bacterium]|nr:phage major capsid protein [Burkholderiales bacterium]
MKLHDLRERSALIIAEMRSLTDKPSGPAGDLSADQTAKFDALKAELTGIEQRMARQQLIDDFERRAEGTTIAGTGDNRLDEAARRFSLRRAICSQVPDLASQTDAGLERELSAEFAKRAGRTFSGMCVPMAVLEVERRTLVAGGGSPDSGGINLVATDLRPDQFINLLRPATRVRAAGATVLTGLHGNFELPKQASTAATNWVAEDTALSQGDPTYQKIAFSPNHCGSLSEFSRNMLLQSSPDIEQLLRMDFAKTLANALDVAALNGAGGTEPRGILQTTGLTTVNGPISWSAILQMIETVEEANTEGTAWMTTPGMKRLLRSTPKVASTDSVMTMESARELAGYPLFTSNNVPPNMGSPADSDALIYGDWRDLIIAIWSELDLLVNPFAESAYRRGNVLVRGMMSVDLAPRHIESFVAMTNVNPG